MSRFAPYISTVCALLFGVFVSVFSSGATILSIPANATSTAPSSLSVFPGFTLPGILLPSHEPNASAATVTSVMPKLSRSNRVPVASPPLKETPIPGSSPTDMSAVTLRTALVNIICYAPANSALHSISGSGVMVDQKGIILTNAHIAQYFLLANRDVSCTIRTGGPAIDSYEASLMYISPAWLNANPTVLTEASPIGTGEYDFAFLAVTSSATSTKLPTSFPSMPLATEPPHIGTSVAIASYGAQSLGFNQIQSSLFPTVVFDSVRDVFTFAIDTVDAFALGGSAAAQEGSSGGGVVDSQGKLVGMLTTSTIGGDMSMRVLDAITASYIRAEYAKETGQSLDTLFAKPPVAAAASFAPQMPTLESILTSHLP